MQSTHSVLGRRPLSRSPPPLPSGPPALAVAGIQARRPSSRSPPPLPAVKASFASAASAADAAGAAGAAAPLPLSAQRLSNISHVVRLKKAPAVVATAAEPVAITLSSAMRRTAVVRNDDNDEDEDDGWRGKSRIFRRYAVTPAHETRICTLTY
jgi:hypothetical protein